MLEERSEGFTSTGEMTEQSKEGRRKRIFYG
jgi:hypothetical protein